MPACPAQGVGRGVGPSNETYGAAADAAHTARVRPPWHPQPKKKTIRVPGATPGPDKRERESEREMDPVFVIQCGRSPAHPARCRGICGPALTRGPGGLALARRKGYSLPSRPLRRCAARIWLVWGRRRGGGLTPSSRRRRANQRYRVNPPRCSSRCSGPEAGSIQRGRSSPTPVYSRDRRGFGHARGCIRAASPPSGTMRRHRCSNQR